ncbi:MAG: DUF3500 domain-containing protein [Blastocatellia bacterium]
MRTPRKQEVLKDRRAFLKEFMATTGLFLVSPESSLCSNLYQSASRRGRTSHSAAAMAAAATAFLQSLSAEQMATALFPFQDAQRRDWNYRPRVGDELRSKEKDEFRQQFLASLPRPKGIALKDMNPSQRRLAENLLSVGLSGHGLKKARGIISLEPIVKELDRGNPVWDPESYSFILFGHLPSKRPWAWSMEGHHLSLNFTVTNNDRVASTPSFFGAVPAEVPDGQHKGMRVLAAEEDMARMLLKSLDERQRAKAMISAFAPRDILSGVRRKMDPFTPAGIRAGLLSQQHAQMLMNLLKEYAASMPDDIAALRMSRIRAAGFNNVHFAWAGGIERGQPHYYRIHGPSFLIEYDNVQNNANHIHTVWREFELDFGEDLLARHYKEAHHSAGQKS